MENPFISKLVDVAYVKPESTAADEDRTIFTRYKVGTAKKLQTSIKELKGRFGEDLTGLGGDTQAYENPRPSINWRVTKDTEKDTLDSQRVNVMLKIGISKAVIGPKGEKELTFTPVQAGQWLEEQLQLIEGLEKGTPAGDWFHEIAKVEGEPRSEAKLDGVANAVWEYNEETDTYHAVDGGTPDE